MNNLINHGVHKGEPLYASQMEAISFVRNSKKHFIAINAPTGSGKTILAFEAIAPPLWYLTNSKLLQDQIVREFPEGVALLKGRANYPCARLGTDGYPLFENASLCVLEKPCYYCSYLIAKKKAVASDRATLNFHYFLAAANFVNFCEQDRENRGVCRDIIIDEGDVIFDVLTNFISFSFSPKYLANFSIPLPNPERKTKIEVIVQWLERLEEVVTAEETKLAPIIEGIRDKVTEEELITDLEHTLLKHHQRLKELSWKCNFLLSQELTEDAWVYYFDGDKVTLKPKWLTRTLTDQFLFRHGNRLLLMSASLPPKEIFCMYFGLEWNEVDYLELPPSFPIKNRLVFCMPRYSLSNKEEVDKKVIRRAVKEVLDKEKGHKGLCHSVSFKLTEVLKGLDKRLLFHDSNNKDKQFQKFLESTNGVFVSPSSVRGLDLKDDLARFVIWLKCPFLQLLDPLVQARLYGSGKWGRHWYQAECAMAIMQGSGRAVRHKTDFARVYFLDEQIKKLLLREPKLFLRWFREAIVFE